MSDSRDAERVVAVILCAGQGTRMGAGENKIFLPLAGRPALLWSLAAFGQAPIVDEILLVAHPNELDRVRALAADAPKLRAVIAGGATRAQSETRALAALRTRIESSAIRLVMIHDGARPLITRAEIERVARAARGLGAPGGALLAAPLAPGEEIGEIGPDGLVARRFPTDSLARAQTPQAFDARLLLSAYDRAAAETFDGTDTAATVERLGAPVAVVIGADENLKLTTPDDLHRAEAIIAARRRA